MPLYFSKRAANEALDFKDVETPDSRDATVGAEATVNLAAVKTVLSGSATRHHTERISLRHRLIHAAKTRKRKIRHHLSDIQRGNLVEFKASDVDFGTVKALTGRSGDPAFWVFLLNAFVEDRFRRTRVVAVGSGDDYASFAGGKIIPPIEGDWFPSSPEGRVLVYEKLFLVDSSTVERELELQESIGVMREELNVAGVQARLFADLVSTLQHNSHHGTYTIDRARRRVPKASILATVEDVGSDAQDVSTVLLRLIHVEEAD